MNKILTVDDAIPKILKNELINEISRLENELKGRNFQPGSNQMIHNLVHPSLYPYVPKRSFSLLPFSYLPVLKPDHDQYFFPGRNHFYQNDNTNYDQRNRGRREEDEEEDEENESLEVSSTSSEDQINENFLLPRIAPVEDNTKKLISQFSSRINHSNETILENRSKLMKNFDHPSLFPSNYQIYLEKFKNKINPKNTNQNYSSEDLPKIYQWLSTDFSVDENYNVNFESYINNLNSEKYPRLNQILQSILSLFIPMFEISLGRKLRNHPTLQVIIKLANYEIPKGEEYSGNWHVEGVSERIISSGIYYHSLSKSQKSNLSFRIEKLNEVHHRNEFHVDLGSIDTDVEDRMIVFPNTVQHSVHVSNPIPHFSPYQRLLATNKVNENNNENINNDINNLILNNSRMMNNNLNNQLNYIPLPIINNNNNNNLNNNNFLPPFIHNNNNNNNNNNIKEFANEKENNEKIVEKKEIGHRKIICFFLIDPDKPIISTSFVPPQQWSEYFPIYCKLLEEISRKILIDGREFPLEIIFHILSYTKIGFSELKAKKYQLRLMKQRKFYVNAMNETLEREYSLCEH